MQNEMALWFETLQEFLRVESILEGAFLTYEEKYMCIHGM